ncbi:MAG: transcription antitermination factor NusB [Clostridia bacterium]|nr:transcription antitermination factor NusB [Clostridia bacterium]
MNRTKAREYAFILLFQYKFQPDSIGELIEDFVAEYKPGIQEEYIKNAVNTTIEKIGELDGIIDEKSANWKADRLSYVCQSILRLAICEILYFEDIPVPVSINEAIALIKKYDGEESVNFVNGILGSFKKND